MGASNLVSGVFTGFGNQGAYPPGSLVNTGISSNQLQAVGVYNGLQNVQAIPSPESSAKWIYYRPDGGLMAENEKLKAEVQKLRRLLEPSAVEFRAPEFAERDIEI